MLKTVISDLDEGIEVIRFTSGSKLLAQTKLARGNEMIDIRVWSKWNQDSQWHPGRNGLFIRKDDLKASIAKLQAYLEA